MQVAVSIIGKRNTFTDAAEIKHGRATGSGMGVTAGALSTGAAAVNICGTHRHHHRCCSHTLRACLAALSSSASVCTCLVLQWGKHPTHVQS